MDDIQEPGTEPTTPPEEHETATPASESAGRPPVPDAADQSELDLGVISTGSPAVDAALEPLESVNGLPVGEHPEVFERVLGNLSATLSASDAGGPSDDGRDADEDSSGDPHATASGH